MRARERQESRDGGRSQRETSGGERGRRREKSRVVHCVNREKLEKAGKKLNLKKHAVGYKGTEVYTPGNVIVIALVVIIVVVVVVYVVVCFVCLLFLPSLLISLLLIIIVHMYMLIVIVFF